MTARSQRSSRLPSGLFAIALGFFGLVISPSIAWAQSRGLQEASAWLREAPYPEALSGELHVHVETNLPPNARRGDELAATVTSSLLDALRGSPSIVRLEVSRVDQMTSEPERLEESATIGARGFEWAMFLGVEVRERQLLLSVDWYRLGDGFLPALAPHVQRISSHTHAVGLDAELYGYLISPPRAVEEEIQTQPLVLPGRGYLEIVSATLAQAEPTREASTTLFALAEDHIDVFTLHARTTARGLDFRVQRRARLPLPEATPSPQRSPRPATTAFVEGNAVEGNAVEGNAVDGNAVTFSSSHFLESLRIEAQDGSYQVRAIPSGCSEGVAARTVCLIPVTGRDYFARRSPIRGEGDAEQAPISFYRRAARPILGADGVFHPFSVWVSSSGRLVSRGPSGTGSVLERGIALSMNDMDHDGMPEVLTSDGGDDEGDALHLLRIRPSGAPIALWSGPRLSGSVMASAALDLPFRAFVAIEEPRGGAGNATLHVVWHQPR